MKSAFVLSKRDLLRFALNGALVAAAPTSLMATSAKNSGVRGFGVNCFDLFLGRLINQYKVRSPGVRLAELANLGVNFVRFPVSVYWPRQWRFYLEDRARYFDLLDEIIWAAAHHRIGLVPTFFWNISSVSDLIGETVSAWAKEDSKTWAFAGRFIEDVLSRYAQSDEISVLEFANEINTYVDLPNGYKWWPKTSPSNGTPVQRTNADLFTSRDVETSVSIFSRKVRNHTSSRLLSGGFDAPRRNAFNLSNGTFSIDTNSQSEEYFSRLNKDLDVISIHLYPSADATSQMMLRSMNYMEELRLFEKVSKSQEKPLFVGEFGIRRSGLVSRDRLAYEGLLDNITVSGVGAAALWVYDYMPMENDWSVTVDSDRAYQLELISKYSNRWSSSV